MQGRGGGGGGEGKGEAWEGAEDPAATAGTAARAGAGAGEYLEEVGGGGWEDLVANEDDIPRGRGGGGGRHRRQGGRRHHRGWRPHQGLGFRGGSCWAYGPPRASFWTHIGGNSFHIAQARELWNPSFPCIPKQTASTFFFLCCQELWKHRNGVVFYHEQPSLPRLLANYKEAARPGAVGSLLDIELAF